MTTNADLIAEARRVVLDHKAVASFALIDRLADALEASEKEKVWLRGQLHEARGFVTPLVDGTNWPADLLEAVRHFETVCEYRAMLVRYGLLEGEAK